MHLTSATQAEARHLSLESPKLVELGRPNVEELTRHLLTSGDGTFFPSKAGSDKDDCTYQQDNSRVVRKKKNRPVVESILLLLVRTTNRITRLTREKKKKKNAHYRRHRDVHCTFALATAGGVNRLILLFSITT